MWDLDYVSKQDEFDKLLQESTELANLDEAFKESYIDIIKRFYNMFESIFKYYNEVNSFL